MNINTLLFIAAILIWILGSIFFLAIKGLGLIHLAILVVTFISSLIAIELIDVIGEKTE